MSRVSRREAASGAESVADDLRLGREVGGIAEMRRPHLQGVLDALGLTDPTQEDVAHARNVLTALTSDILGRIMDDHPVREASVRPGSRVPQAWQTIGATSLAALLLRQDGTKGEVVDMRDSTARKFDVHPSTVKRHEDKLLLGLLAARIYDRITAQHHTLPGSVRRRPTTGDSDPLSDSLGSTEHELAESLLVNGRIPGHGFDAQEVGIGEPARSSTGMVTYVLAMTPSIDDVVVSELYEEILGWITPSGVLPRHPGSSTESSWTESQCLLALTGRPHLTAGRPEPARLVNALLRYQQGGGWAFRSEGTEHHPIWNFYPLLAVHRATRAEWLTGFRYRKCADQVAEHTAAYLHSELTTVERLLALAVMNLAKAGSETFNWNDLLVEQTDHLNSQLTYGHAASLPALSIADDRQPLWHARVHPALLYLHARRVLGPNHPFTRGLIDRLLAEFDPLHLGWSNSTHRNAKPYTWATSIALRSCQILRSDIRARRVEVAPPPSSEASAQTA